MSIGKYIKMNRESYPHAISMIRVTLGDRFEDVVVVSWYSGVEVSKGNV